VGTMFNLLNAIVVIGSVSLVIWTIYGYFVLPKMHKISWAYKIRSRPSHSGGLSLPLAVISCVVQVYC
jgi:hypothetical protein